MGGTSSTLSVDIVISNLDMPYIPYGRHTTLHDIHTGLSYHTYRVGASLTAYILTCVQSTATRLLGLQGSVALQVHIHPSAKNEAVSSILHPPSSSPLSGEISMYGGWRVFGERSTWNVWSGISRLASHATRRPLWRDGCLGHRTEARASRSIGQLAGRGPRKGLGT